MNYQLSLWGEKKITNTSSGIVTNEYTKEINYGIIGSNTTESPIAAYNPKLTVKINGQKTLTFKMNAKYYNITSDSYEVNPYLARFEGKAQPIANGRVVKLKTDDNLYVFQIDSITKSSDGLTYEFTCSDNLVDQLSKTGYSIELDTELENNMGSVFDLATTILDESDWQLVDTTPITLKGDNTKTINSDLIRAYNNETLYSYTLGESETLTATDMITGDTLDIDPGETILITESSYRNQNSTIQFFYREDGNYEINEERVITNSPNYKATVNWVTWPTLSTSASYRGRALTLSATTKYISNIDKYCYEYTKNSTDYYMYSENEFLSGISSTNLIGAAASTISISDWTNTELTQEVVNNVVTPVIKMDLYSSSTAKDVINTTINGNKSLFEVTAGINDQYNYILAYKIKSAHSGRAFTQATVQYKPINNTGTWINTYTWSGNTESTGTDDLVGYNYIELATGTNLSLTQIINGNLRLVLKGDFGTEYQPEFYDIKFFPKLVLENKIVVPDITTITDSIIKEKHYYFLKSLITDKITSITDLTYSDIVYKGDAIEDTYSLKVNDDYELITSIEAKQSNRYNLLQTLCEKFECWLNLHVDCDASGRIIYYYKKCASTDIYTPGKQYFVAHNMTEAEKPFDDDHYVYADMDDYFVQQTSANHYIPSYTYYTKVNNNFIPNAQVHQWGEYRDGATAQTFYTLSYSTSGSTTTKTWTAATTYNASTQYYILSDDQTEYIAVSVQNNYVGHETNFYLLNTTAGSCWYEYCYTRVYGKYITFNEYIGNTNIAPFSYGINLNGITRKVDSEKIVTKLIVADNSNEYAENGFCSIADAAQNYTGSNTLYDFNYYINQNIIDAEDFNTDMYGGDGTGFNYYGQYVIINSATKTLIDEQTALTTSLVTLEAEYQTYANLASQARDNYTTAIDSILSAALQAGLKKTEAGHTTEDWDWDYAKVKTYDATAYPSTVNTAIIERDQYLLNINKYEARAFDLQNECNVKTEQLTNITQKTNEYSKLKKALDYQLYQKYKTYIKEGTWNSEDYYDADLYFNAANEVLTTSAYPEVSYTFSVIDLNELDGWNSYKFGIGDKTYVRDKEFFADQGKIALEVILSEITWDLENPQNTSITVQNYATAFEDLFQKVAATTQTLQYNEGRYDKAGAMATDTEEGSALVSKMLSQNSAIVSAANGQFNYDASGITAIDKNANYQVKLTTRGLVISKDGGETWTTGISAEGVSADIVNTGTLNADRVKIYGGKNNELFEWDAYGLNAYSGNGVTQNKSKYVRFDKWGLYGVNAEEHDWQPVSTSEIKSHGQFGLLWDGFFLKTNNGSVQISTTDDIVVNDGTRNRIKIGALGNSLYGMRLTDSSGTTTLVTGSNGKLLLGDSLTIGAISGDTISSSIASMGYLSATRSGTSIHEVIHAGTSSGDNEFIVYEDGYVKARGGEFGSELHIGKFTVPYNYAITTTLQTGSTLSSVSITGYTLTTAGTHNFTYNSSSTWTYGSTTYTRNQLQTHFGINYLGTPVVNDIISIVVTLNSNTDAYHFNVASNGNLTLLNDSGIIAVSIANDGYIKLGNHFKVDTTGKVTATSLELTGGTVNGSTISSSTISGNTITGGTISGATITADDGTIGGWSIDENDIHADDTYTMSGTTYTIRTALIDDGKLSYSAWASGGSTITGTAGIETTITSGGALGLNLQGVGTYNDGTLVTDWKTATALDTFAVRNIMASTEDLTPGTSPLGQGKIQLVYT